MTIIIYDINTYIYIYIISSNIGEQIKARSSFAWFSLLTTELELGNGRVGVFILFYFWVGGVGWRGGAHS